MRIRHLITAAVLPVIATLAAADIDPLTGIDFATIGAAGNAPWTGSGQSDGRGQVNYEYRIAKTEVTGGLWTEFLTAAYDRPQSEWIPFLNPSPTVSGPGNHMVGGITWRQAAIFCNWLTNGRATNREAFLTGAYDVSTFSNLQPYGFSDQRERSAGATYFLPTWDEWLKAAHYDPNKQNADGSTGGWWRYANMRDEPLIYGPPPSFGGDGTGMANAGFNLPGFNERNILVGSYPTQLSPWGLLDTAGGMREWLESGFYNESIGAIEGRYSDGSGWGSSSGTALAGDDIWFRAGEAPNVGWSDFGLRIAASPLPGTVCDTIDFNHDGLLPDVQDIADFLTVFSGGPCPTDVCSDIDFNRDGIFPDVADIQALLRVFSGGECV